MKETDEDDKRCECGESTGEYGTICECAKGPFCDSCFEDHRVVCPDAIEANRDNE